jgi:hypothetical protein
MEHFFGTIRQLPLFQSAFRLFQYLLVVDVKRLSFRRQAIQFRVSRSTETVATIRRGSLS